MYITHSKHIYELYELLSSSQQIPGDMFVNLTYTITQTCCYLLCKRTESVKRF